MQRTSEFLEKHVLPAAQRAGATQVGAFVSLIAPGSPFLLLVTSYPSLAALETGIGKLEADAEFRNARDAYNGKPGLGYVRMSTTLLKAFDSMPVIEVPPTGDKRPLRVFEVRIYESNNTTTLRKKVGMFEEGGEIAIFRRTGLTPVFFGTTIAGQNMPNLTYMLAYDDLAAREKNWRTFLADPEWVKLRSTPGLSDAEIVSNISNWLVRPLPFSPIR